MTKRTQHVNTGITQESEGGAAPIPPSIYGDVTYEQHQQYEYEDTLQRLIDSGVVVAAEGAISWRAGHLEHVARLYVSDPAQAWRDYADDLTVALAADGSNFAMLVERARGE